MFQRGFSARLDDGAFVGRNARAGVGDDDVDPVGGAVGRRGFDADAHREVGSLVVSDRVTDEFRDGGPQSLVGANRGRHRTAQREVDCRVLRVELREDRLDGRTGIVPGGRRHVFGKQRLDVGGLLSLLGQRLRTRLDGIKQGS